MNSTSPVTSAQNSISTGGKIVLILLLGGLSLFFAEVFSGASVLWFLQPWAWAVTLPLYMFHALLLLNLAMIFRRRSLASLYLWGVLFGLYESWITKVVWAGYMNQSPAMGTFLGFAVLEAPLIVLFWHPVMSFILPILTFQVLAGKPELPGHAGILTKTRTTWALALLLILIGASSLDMNANYNVIASVLTIVGSIVYIGIFYVIATKKYAPWFSIKSLKLGRLGLALNVLYLILLYAWAFFNLLPGRIPQWPTMLLTLCFYGVILGLLWMKKPDIEENAASVGEMLSRKDAGILAIILLALAIAFCLVPAAGRMLEIAVYLGTFIISLILFVGVTFRVIGDRLKD